MTLPLPRPTPAGAPRGCSRRRPDTPVPCGSQGGDKCEEVERRGGRGTIRNAIADFKAHPDKYVAMRYSTDMHDEDWEEQDCTLFLPPDQTIVVARV